MAWLRYLPQDSGLAMGTAPEDPDAAPLDALDSGLKVVQELHSRIIKVTFIDNDPTIAALVVNRSVEAYIDYLTRQRRISTHRELTAVSDSISRTQSELARAVNEKETYLFTNALGVLTRDAGRLSRLRVLELQLDAVTARYNEMLARRELLMQRSKAPEPGISILSAAWPPVDPRTMSPIYLIPPGVILFGLLGASIAVLRHGFDDRIRSEAQSETALGVPSAGMLPNFDRPTARSLRRLLVDQPHSTHGRAASSILVSLAPCTVPWPSQIRLVTATARDDGKTELAWSLALSASRFRQRVLFIDFDARQSPPTLSFRHEFGSGRKSGSLADLAEQQCALSEAIESIPGIGVEFLRSTADSTDIFARLSAANIRQSLEELSKQYDLLILNGPAVTEGPEVRLLAGCADDVLFAIRWGVTRQHLARAALEMLGKDGPPYIIRSVLTEVNLKKHKRFRLKDSGDLLRMIP